MSKSIFERSRALASLCVATLICAIILVVGEFSVRVFFPQVRFVGQDASLMEAERFGSSPGNKPLALGRSWGARVSTDQFGFRVPVEAVPVSSNGCRTVVIGDSVVFGVGVAAEQTFPVLLSRSLDEDICNAGVIGYGIDDYGEFVDSFLLPNQRALGTSRVLLFLTLNDIYGTTTAASEAQRKLADEIKTSAIEKMARKLRAVLDFNRFLIKRSKLYLGIKGVTYDASRWWFLADFGAYKDPKKVEKFTTQLRELLKRIRDAQIEIIVFVFPYEYQLRLRNDELLEPQRILTRYLEDARVPYWDLYEDFRRSAHTRLFLFNDHCHLSEEGHALVAETVLRKLDTLSELEPSTHDIE